MSAFYCPSDSTSTTPQCGPPSLCRFHCLLQGEAEKRSGFWWSLDSKHIAFSQVDATGASSSPTVHEGENGDDRQANLAGPSATEAKEGSLVRLGIVPATGGEVSWVQLLLGGTEHDDEDCLARVMWLPDGYLIAEVQNRARTNLKLLKFNPTSGQRQVLLEERVTTPILSDCFTPLKTGGFIWASERSGFRHLYLYDAAGECLGPLTSGNWTVEQVAGVDENVGIIYFMGKSGHLETHLYSTLIFPDYSFPIEEPKQLTRGPGKHVVVLDHRKEKFVDILDGVDHAPPRVQVCSLANRRVISPQMPVTPVPNPEPTSTQEFHTVTPQPPRQDLGGLDDRAREELQKAAAILLQHTSVLCEGLCRGCKPVLEQLLTQLALFDPPETTMNHSLIDDDGTGHSDVEDEPQNEAPPSTDTNGDHRDAVSDALVGEHPQPGTVTDTGSVDDPAAPDTNGNHYDRVSTRDHLQPGTVNRTGVVGDTASGGVTPVRTASRRDKARLWSEEQSSGSDEELAAAPVEDARTGEPEPTADVRAPKAVPGRIQSTPNNGRTLSFHSPNAVSNFAWANANLFSPKQAEDVKSPKSGTPEGNGKVELPSPSPAPAPKLTRSAQEAIRMKGVVRKKDFECIERMRGGRLTNVVEGLELHSKVFNNIEQQKLVDMVGHYQELGRQGKLRGKCCPSFYPEFLIIVIVTQKN